MVIDFFATSRPSPMEWSLIFLCHIKALSNGMVIDFLMFPSRPSPMEWLLIFLCFHQGPLRWNGHWFSYVSIKAISDGMVIDFLMFTSRPSPMEWSLIFLCLHQGSLRWNGHWFSYVYIKALSDGMVIYFLLHVKALSNGMVIDFFVTMGPSPSKWPSLFSSLDHDPFLWIGHCICLICFFPLFLWNPNEISVFIFTHLLLW